MDTQLSKSLRLGKFGFKTFKTFQVLETLKVGKSTDTDERNAIYSTEQRKMDGV